MSQNPYYRAAKKRFPGYTVSGSGPWAVVNRSLNYVHLNDFEDLATREFSARSDKAFCSLIRLQPDYGVVLPLARIPGQGIDE